MHSSGNTVVEVVVVVVVVSTASATMYKLPRVSASFGTTTGILLETLSLVSLNVCVILSA